jgi:hypothetical protein
MTIRNLRDDCVGPSPVSLLFGAPDTHDVGQAMEDDEIKETTSVRGESWVHSIGMGKFCISEMIHFPGGATIVMAPFGLVSSADGCKALATRD